MPTIVVLPVKSFHLGKGRLAEILNPEERSQLGRSLAQRTLVIVEEAGLIPVVVAGDDTVASWSLSSGVPTVLDPGDGLSAAAAAGVAWARNVVDSWMVLHSDLPLLTPADFDSVIQAVELGRDVIAPSTDGGTSLIGGTTGFDFAYGPGSFAVHMSRLREPVIVSSLGLLHDLDSGDDLESALSHPRGRWLREIIHTVES